MGISFLFSFAFHFSSFLRQPFCHFAFLFLGKVLITVSCTMLRTSIHSSSSTLSDIIPWIYLSLPLYNHSESEVAQSCPTLSDLMDCSLPGSSIHGIFQAIVLEWVAISFSNAWKWKVKVKSLTQVQLLATSWTAAYQAPQSMGFSRQEYWSGVPLPSPEKATLCIYNFVIKAK